MKYFMHCSKCAQSNTKSGMTILPALFIGSCAKSTVSIVMYSGMEVKLFRLIRKYIIDDRMWGRCGKQGQESAMLVVVDALGSVSKKPKSTWNQMRFQTKKEQCTSLLCLGQGFR